MEQCNIQHAISGIEATECYRSTTVDLTKQVEPSFALPLGGGRGGGVWPLHGSKTEGRKEGVSVCACVDACMCVCMHACMRACVCVCACV